MTKYNGKEIDFITKGHCYLFVFVCLIFFYILFSFYNDL